MFPNILAEAFIRTGVLLDAPNRDKQSAFSRYYVAATEAFPELINGDVFGYLDYIRHNPPRMVFKDFELDKPKSNLEAVTLRQEGNKLFAKKMYEDAMGKYNESICWALGDSEDLGIGFANRSAVCYEIQEYEFALANIQLARQHNYPERLMSKLVAREHNCNAKIQARENKSSNKCPKFVMKLEANPTIPIMVKGITLGKYRGLGYGMKAEKDFKVGDVILHERSKIVANGPEVKFTACDHCASGNDALLIPCPHCVEVMYCTQECLQISWKEYHRFVCGSLKILSAAPFGAHSIGLKMFFYGLTQFNDNVNEMMKYCKANTRKEINPFDRNYIKPDPLDTFKFFHTVKVERSSSMMNLLTQPSAAFVCGIYFEQPLIRSLFKKKKQLRFMLQSIHDYMNASCKMIIGLWDSVPFFQLASFFNHSCVPNTHTVFNSGEVKFIVLRPIQKNEQILISYESGIGKTDKLDRFIMTTILDFTCACEICKPTAAPKLMKRHPQAFHKHLEVVHQIVRDEDCTKLDKLNAAQQFIQLYGYAHPLVEVRELIILYQNLLRMSFDDEMMDQMRNKISVGN
ncbi:uncharacterized protein LOC134221305 [Armigeres subalbatus]|uniref:uncharacterized protein LOC134221305 n=1 Tax=Armigeres subalbatus TaxID=124917 RepID=UPI002ED4428F